VGKKRGAVNLGKGFERSHLPYTELLWVGGRVNGSIELNKDLGQKLLGIANPQEEKEGEKGKKKKKRRPHRYVPINLWS